MASQKEREERFGVLGSPELNLTPPSSSRENEGGHSQMAGIQSPQFPHSSNAAMENDSPIKIRRAKQELCIQAL